MTSQITSEAETRPQARQPQPPPSPAPTPAWYYERAGQRHGPLSDEKIRFIVSRGGLSATTLVWRSGWSDWQPLDATELRTHLAAQTTTGIVTTGSTPGTTWHYEWCGQRLGPHSMTEMESLIANRTLTRGTLVWRSGLDAWTPVESTELGERLKLTTPPPLDGARVNNNVVWLLAVSPLLVDALRIALILIEAHGNEALADRLIAGNAYWVLGPIANIALSYWDESVLKKAGVNTKLLGQPWLVPVYLFKRAKFLTQMPAYAWTWVALFVLGRLPAYA